MIVVEDATADFVDQLYDALEPYRLVAPWCVARSALREHLIAIANLTTTAAADLIAIARLMTAAAKEMN